MYTGRTQNAQQIFLAASIVLMTGITASLFGGVTPVFANPGTTHRLSSNPHDLRDAFAPHPNNVNTPEAFANFVAQNQALGQRYARHFGVPQDQLTSFFKTSLVPTTLTKKQKFTTYGVTKSGMIYPVKTTLGKGAKVWATREGVPVIKWNCSNPLMSMLPGSMLNTPPLEYANTASPILPSNDTPGVTVPQVFSTVGSPSLPESGDSVAIAPATDAPSFAFGVPSVSTASADSLPGVGEVIDAGSSNVKDLWPALLVPLVLGINTGHGGDDTPIYHGQSEPYLPGGNNTGGGDNPPTGPLVVPESNTAGLLVMGLPLLGATLAFARRRKLA